MVLLLEEVTLDLALLDELEVFFCIESAFNSSRSQTETPPARPYSFASIFKFRHPNPTLHPAISTRSSEDSSLTPQDTALLQVVHALPLVALAKLLTNKTSHHAAHPLLTDNGVTGVVDGDVVLEIDTLVGRGDGGLFSQEGS